ncbi:MAG: FG-GAP-like repeat-containing protein [Myxococcales bacterium]
MEDSEAVEDTGVASRGSRGPGQPDSHGINPSDESSLFLVSGDTGSVDELNQISYQGGAIMPNVNVKPIFYGTWAQADENLILTFLHDVSGSPYWQINTTYFNPADHTRVSPYLSVLSKLELPDAPQGTSPATTKMIVEAQLDSGALQADDSVIYVVFTSSDIQLGNLHSACGYHSKWTYNSTAIKFALVPMPTRTACGLKDPSPNDRPAADAALSTLAHELMETETDPNHDAWGARGKEKENGDRCAWKFGATYRTANGAIANLQLRGHDYKVQQNFVNRSGGYCAMRLRPNGDVDGDGNADVIALGGSGWDTLPLSISNGDGTFRVAPGTLDDASFAVFASSPNVQRVPGYYRGDGLAGVAILGGNGWGSIPVALSNGDGSFHVTNTYIPDYGGAFGSWAQVSKAVPGDFNSDGCTDIALVGGPGWTSVPIAFSNCDGSFHVTKAQSEDFSTRASGQGVKALPGDFDGDGRGDIALLGPGSPDIPIAFSNGDGTFTVTAANAASFASQAGDSSVRALTGDVNGDGTSDITLVSPRSDRISVGFSAGDGTFAVRSYQQAAFAAFAAKPAAMVVSLDLNGDGFSDLVAAGKNGTNNIVSITSRGPLGYGGGSSDYTEFGPSDLSWQARNRSSSILGNF